MKERDRRIVERDNQREILVSRYYSRGLVGNASKNLRKMNVIKTL